MTEFSDHYVYRFFDAADRLLYVGVTLDFKTRWRCHRRMKSWWPDVARVSLTGPLPGAEAYAWEHAAITTERPLHNISTTRGRPRDSGDLDGTARTRIARVAAHERHWRKERDDLLVRAIRDGYGVRKAAKAAGLDHSTVLAILKREGGRGGPADHAR